MPENSNRLCISYMFSLIAAAVILVATNSALEIPIGSAAVFVALLWASSLSVINLHSTVVVMVLPVMMISVMKYDAGTTALVAAIGSLSLQEYRILVECNPAGLAVLKMVCNRAIIALCALASYAVFHLVWPYLAPDFSSIRFLLAAIASGLAWVLVSGVTVNLHVMLSQPQFRFRLDPGVVFASLNSVLPSALMGLMAAALYEYGGLIAYILTEAFFISNKNYTQRALVKQENAEQINVALARIIDSKDHYTGGHSERVAMLARRLAEAYHLSRGEVEEIEYVARLHDIGKVNLSDQILTKTKSLSPEEFDEIRKHPAWGAELIRGMEKIYGDKDYRAILEHHERYDGGGYPDGKRAEEISLWARILAICDAYDAMTTERVYRPAVPKDVACAEIGRCAGTQFDPKLATLFLSKVQGW